MAQKDITSLRSTIQFLEEEGELLTIKGEVDPIYEISGIQKSLENGPTLLFDNIKGYPGVRSVGNIFAREERVAKVFGVPDRRKLKFKCADAIRNPIPPKLVKEAPCQEVVTSKNIDVMATLPMLKHTEEDGGRILGGGNTFVSGRYFRNGTHISFSRMNFRGKDWSSITFNLRTHLEWILMEHRGDRVPVTINIGTPPAVMLAAGTMYIYPIVPVGSDELGIAGGLMGSPVDICKAKTVDAYAIAQSEWVIEGYIDTTQVVFETDEAEQRGEVGRFPFFPEYEGYLGRAWRAYKFQVTGLTHRKDRPIFFTPLAHSFEGVSLWGGWLKEACFYELAERLIPGFVTDVNMLQAFKGLGVVFQVRKRRGRDEGAQRDILSAALGVMPALRIVIVVDEDVDIYSTDDIMWAITTRVNPARDIIRGISGRGFGNLPTEEVRQAGVATYEGGLGIDATAPFEEKWHFKRGHYPVDRIALKNWLSDEQIASAQASQCEYAKVLARIGN